ncbi:putative protein kinase RLK-Pelle-WAK family [Rosa chinensis]|uniref:Protein kinase domain-containing protein n=1 Tax=Rosa chinensis TaxID=74649 RepID=A0A2P6P5C2_ROSCH|nr:putative protein kinase RLK-Pelle-WAK family [Rosa chinensis]
MDRILGQGGQGTVYKGMLAAGRIVSVKKSNIFNEGEVGKFINEIVILSQVSHRNLVKLLGCCMETKVPLLIYEFIPNGTLSHYIQHQNEEFPLTWEVRLRVAIEVAGAISYLHSSASSPIYHRDIKSSNILLDGKFRAKVKDFGTSRSVAIDKTHRTMTNGELVALSNGGSAPDLGRIGGGLVRRSFKSFLIGKPLTRPPVNPAAFKAQFLRTWMDVTLVMLKKKSGKLFGSRNKNHRPSKKSNVATLRHSYPTITGIDPSPSDKGKGKIQAFPVRVTCPLLDWLYHF